MVVYGYAKQTRYNNDGICEIQVRIPNIHGPFRQSDAGGKTIHNYVRDEDLPYYPAIISNEIRVDDGDVVILQDSNSGMGSDFIITGVTGASYYSGLVD